MEGHNSRRGSLMEHMDETKFIPVAVEIPLQQLQRVPPGHDLIIRMRSSEIVGTESIQEGEQLDESRFINDTVIRVRKTSSTEQPSSVEIFHPRQSAHSSPHHNSDQEPGLFSINAALSKIRKISGTTKSSDPQSATSPPPSTHKEEGKYLVIDEIEENEGSSEEEKTMGRSTIEHYENQGFENDDGLRQSSSNGNGIDGRRGRRKGINWGNERLVEKVKKISVGEQPDANELIHVLKSDKDKERHYFKNGTQSQQLNTNENELLGVEKSMRRRSTVTCPNGEQSNGTEVITGIPFKKKDDHSITNVEGDSNFNKDEYNTKKLPQVIAALAASLGAFAFGTVLAWSATGTASLLASKEFGELSENEISWISSIAILGAVCACPVAGFGMGQYGRRKVMMYLTGPFILGWVLIALARDTWQIMMGRFLTGLCGGCFSIAVPIFTSETSDTEIRGGLGTFFDILLSAGMLYIYVIGQYASWRMQAAACAIIPIAFHCIIFFIPESPRYLVEKEKLAKAEKAMYWLKGVKTAPELVKWEMSEMRRSVCELKESKFTIRETFRMPIVKPTALMFGIMFFTTLSGFDTVIAYTVHIFDSANTGIDSGLSTVIIGIVCTLSTFPAALLVDHAGRRLLLMGSGLFMFFSLGGLGFFFFIKSGGGGESLPSAEQLSWLPLTSLIAFIIAFSNGFGPLHILMIGEVLPNHLKGLTSCLALMCRWGLAFLETNYFHSLNDIINEHGTYWLFATVSLISVPFVYFFVPETKGKSVDEIQIYFVKA